MKSLLHKAKQQGITKLYIYLLHRNQYQNHRIMKQTYLSKDANSFKETAIFTYIAPNETRQPYFNTAYTLRKITYTPSIKLIIFDLFFVGGFSYPIALLFNSFHSINSYKLFIMFMGIWLITSYGVRKYLPISQQKRGKLFLKTALTTMMTLVFTSYCASKFEINTQNLQLPILAAITLTLNLLYNFLLYSINIATEYPENLTIEQTDKALLEHTTINAAMKIVREYLNENELDYLRRNVRFDESNSFVYASPDINVLEHIIPQQYNTIIQLTKLNQLSNINKTLIKTNTLLSNSGLFICSFETKSTYKKRFLSKYPKGLNYIVYSIDFIIHRILPKIKLTCLFYNLCSERNYRVLSKAEVLGRLYGCGFAIEGEKKINGVNYLFARRVREPYITNYSNYGPFIKLKRVGKNGKEINILKIRTMHPYSEYLQKYIFEKNNLKEGGKFNKDIRITTIGKIMRKYWIDELPMLYNLLKGDIKIVGVRPLSKHYFELYGKELQETRINYKPGLLPPFYADLPRTLGEIQASEMKYLTRCREESIFKTDLKYLFLIAKNILFNNARSA